MSYIRWCRNRNLTLGGSPGTMPDVVPDATIAVAVHPVSDGSGVVGGDPLGLGEDEDGEDEEDEDGDNEESGEEDRGEHCRLDQEVGPTRDPRATLAAAGIAFDAFESIPCAGIVWRHGYCMCPFGERITIDNVWLVPIYGKDRALQMAGLCRGCTRLLRRIRKWMCEGKYTPAGTQLCRRTACAQPVTALWHCRYHTEQRTRYHHSSIQRRTKARTIALDAMRSFLQSVQTRMSTLVSPAWCAVRKAMRATHLDAKVFFIDTESVYDRVARVFLVCEIALVSAQGHLVFHSLVDHGLSFGQLRERVDAALWSKLDRVYRFQDVDSVTTGLTAEDMGSRLGKLGLCPDAHLVEWSLNGFDLRALRGTLASHASGLLPQTALLGYHLWRALGLQGSVALQPLFQSYRPASPLNSTHHEAPIDAAKLYIMVEAALGHFA